MATSPDDGEKKTKLESTHSSSLLKPYEKLEKHCAYSGSVTFKDENRVDTHLRNDFVLTPSAKRQPLFLFYPSKGGSKTVDNSKVYSLENTAKAITTKEITLDSGKQNSSQYYKFHLAVIAKNGNYRTVTIAYNAESLIFTQLAGHPAAKFPPGTPFPPLPELSIGHVFNADPKNGLDALAVLTNFLLEKGFSPSRSPEEVATALRTQGKKYWFDRAFTRDPNQPTRVILCPDANGGTTLYQVEGQEERYYLGSDTLFVDPARSRPITPHFDYGMLVTRLSNLDLSNDPETNTSSSHVTMANRSSEGATSTTSSSSTTSSEATTTASMDTRDSRPNW